MKNNIINFAAKREKILIDANDEAMAMFMGVSLGTYRASYKGPAVKRKIREYSKDFNGTLSDDEVIVRLGCVTRRSYLKYKKSLEATLKNV